MAQAASLTRTDRALGIAQRHEAIPLETLPGHYSVRDTLTGSGTIHVTSLTSCDCADFSFRRRPCKHVEAVRATETALQDYAAAWDAAARPVCPTCGAGLVCVPYHVGGRGLVDVEHCAADKTHWSRRA